MCQSWKMMVVQSLVIVHDVGGNVLSDSAVLLYDRHSHSWHRHNLWSNHLKVLNLCPLQLPDFHLLNAVLLPLSDTSVDRLSPDISTVCKVFFILWVDASCLRSCWQTSLKRSAGWSSGRCPALHTLYMERAFSASGRARRGGDVCLVYWHAAAQQLWWLCLPFDAQDLSEAMEVEVLQTVLLLDIGGPGFAAVEKGTENTCLLIIRWLLVQTLLFSLAITLAALAILLSISLSRDKLLLIMEPSIGEMIRDFKRFIVDGDGAAFLLCSYNPAIFQL